MTLGKLKSSPSIECPKEQNPKRGPTEGAGNTKPEERTSAWMKASKSGSFVCGNRFRPESK
jgi:hypothetical protein